MQRNDFSVFGRMPANYYKGAGQQAAPISHDDRSQRLILFSYSLAYIARNFPRESDHGLENCARLDSRIAESHHCPSARATVLAMRMDGTVEWPGPS